MKTLILKNSNWLRGEGPNNSYLLRALDRKRCCLGILASECGVPDVYTKDAKIPSRLNGTPWEPAVFEFSLTWSRLRFNEEGMCSLESAISERNDRYYGTDQERINALEPLFNKAGYTLVFDAEA